MLTTIHRLIEGLTQFLLRVAGGLCVILVLLTTQQVLSRYLFGDSSIAMQELEWHIFGAIFLLAAAGTLAKNEHVRVDLFYSRYPPRVKHLVDILGTVLFLIPMAWVLTSYGIDYALQARSYGQVDPQASLWAWITAGEASPDPGGLSGRWLVKALIPLGGALLLLQSVALLIAKTTDLILGGPSDG